MLILTYGINYLNKDKQFYTEGERSDNFNLVNYVKTTAVNSATYYLIINNLSSEKIHMSKDILYFIPKSFIFELILDFGHYWAHRIVHMSPILYRIVHKKHHIHNLIDVNTSYSHNASDYLITNMLPMLLSSYLIPMSKYQFTIQFVYKSLVEIGGHSGKIQKTSSFPQCIWIPRFLGIELTNKDHNQHHINHLSNFSKRFSLWDKLFGTYENK